MFYFFFFRCLCMYLIVIRIEAAIPCEGMHRPSCDLYVTETNPGFRRFKSLRIEVLWLKIQIEGETAISIWLGICYLICHMLNVPQLAQHSQCGVAILDTGNNCIK